MTAATYTFRQRPPEPERRRTFAPVRRNSRPAGGEAWPALSRDEANLRLFALKAYQKRLRKPGQRVGAEDTICDGAIELYELLLNMAVKHGGRVEPSVAWLASRGVLNRPRRLIHKWKAQLKAHGFLDWIRRYVETGREGRRGPQVAQTSNAYVTRLPSRAMALVRKIWKRNGGRPQKPRPSVEMTVRAARKEAHLADRAAEDLNGLAGALDRLDQARARLTGESSERELPETSQSGPQN